MIEALRARRATAEVTAWERLRRQAVERVTADGERHRGRRRFSGRGRKRVRCRVGLTRSAPNLVTPLAEEERAPEDKAKAAAVNSVGVAT